jgi:hypothetical protein
MTAGNMSRLKQAAVLLDMAGQLRDRGSWCGETHLQKASYFLQELLNVPTGFSFVLYKHGPFSFDLRDALTAMRADGLLDLVPQEPYGPSLVPTELGIELKKLYPRTLQKHSKEIRFVADNLGNQNVSELEKLATALFITLQDESRSVGDRASEIHILKPHVDLHDAKLAVKMIDKVVTEARNL